MVLPTKLRVVPQWLESREKITKKYFFVSLFYRREERIYVMGIVKLYFFLIVTRGSIIGSTEV